MHLWQGYVSGPQPKHLLVADRQRLQSWGTDGTNHHPWLRRHALSRPRAEALPSARDLSRPCSQALAFSTTLHGPDDRSLGARHGLGS